MSRSSHIAVLILVLNASGAQAGPIAGTWRYESKVPDPVYGEPEHLVLEIRVEGKKLCGTYLSAYRGGMRVAEGRFSGRLTGATGSVRYEAGWAEVAGEGRATLRRTGTTLTWRVETPGPEPDFMIKSAVLVRTAKSIGAAIRCK